MPLETSVVLLAFCKLIPGSRVLNHFCKMWSTCCNCNKSNMSICKERFPIRNCVRANRRCRQIHVIFIMHRFFSAWNYCGNSHRDENPICPLAEQVPLSCFLLLLWLKSLFCRCYGGQQKSSMVQCYVMCGSRHWYFIDKILNDQAKPILKARVHKKWEN